MMTLPASFNTELQTIPAMVPYLHPDPQLLEQWAAKLDSTCGQFRVGLAWAGNPTHRRDRRRSLPLNLLEPLSVAKDTTFVSLQLGPASAQARHPPLGLTLLDFTSELRDFADTAALIANLDLVIAVDTAVVHLAGALAKPAWVMIPRSPDWRWLLDRDDSPWYPTLRLFRQKTSGDWPEVIQRVSDALAEKTR
jgi:hypothetical protein